MSKMFGFLKDKLKKAVEKFTKKAEDEADVVEVVEETKDVPVSKPVPKKVDKKQEKVKSEPKEEEKEETKETKPTHKIIDVPIPDKEKEKLTGKKTDGITDSKSETLKEPEQVKKEISDIPEEIKEPEVIISDEEDKIKEEEIPETLADEVTEPEEEAEETKPDEEIIEEKTVDDTDDDVQEDSAEETLEEEEEELEPAEEIKEETKKEGFFKKLFKKKEKETVEEKEIEEKTVQESKEIIDEPVVEVKEEKEEVINEAPTEESVEEIKPVETDTEEEVKEEKKGFFQKITETVTKVSLSEKKFNELFWELEVTLLENNVAVEVIEKIKNDLKEDIVNNKVARSELDVKVIASLKKSILGLFNVDKIDILKNIKSKKPYVIVFIGINGVGKTTNLAKLAYLLKKNGLTCVVGACDTFRAAAIQQLEEHTINVGVKLIKHDYGSDPAAVAFDTIKHAESQNADVVLLDTAGRLHSNKNLMQELVKVIRVSKPDLKIFVGESLAGNDVVEQARLFNDAVGIDGIILSKADTDEKGGAAISVTHITGKPILYLGVGQTYEDLEKFDKDKLIEKIGL
jgi:fused signal recognition particle receptor